MEQEIQELYNKSLNYLYSSNYNQSEKCILEILEVYNTNSDIYNFYGRLKQFQGDFNKSIELLKKSVELDNNNYMAHYNLGLAYVMKKDMENTKKSFTNYINNCDNENKFYVNLYISKLHFDLLDINETKDYYIKSDINLFKKLSELLIPRIYNSVEEIEMYRDQYNKVLDDLYNNYEEYIIKSDEEFLNYLQFIYCYTFPLSYQGLNNVNILKKQCLTYRKILPQLNYTSVYLDEIKSTKREKIKIGFISTNFFNQSVTRDRMGVIRNISRDIFDVVVFYYFKPSDDLGGFIWNGENKNIILPETNIFDRRKIIENEKLDILIFCDIGMAPDTFFLAFSRLAPIQCTTWGHSDTSGIDTIDYYLSSTYYEDNNSYENYSEKLILLDSLCTYYYKIIQEPEYGKKIDFCISNNVNTYLCSQVLFKIHPNFDKIMNDILEKDKNGVLLFIKMNVGKYIQNILINRLTKTLKNNITRVHFIDWQTCEREYYKLLSIADVIIDPHPFGGCNTSFSAFGMGIPIITYPAKLINGRFTYGLYKKMQILDLIVDNDEDYVKMAIKCGTDKEYRKNISLKIYENSRKIFNEIESIMSWTKFCILSVNNKLDKENNNSIIIDNNIENINELKNVNIQNLIHTNDNISIPKIIHFIFFGETEFYFLHYYAIKTAYENNKDYHIYLYNTKQPVNNEWWIKTLKYVKLVNIDTPTHINGIKLANYAHKADVLRLQKLIEYGGIYLDIDVWTIKNFDNLLNINKSCIMGYQCKNTKFEGLCNAVIIAQPNSLFLQKWYELYDNYNPNEWDTLSVYAPKLLAEQFSDLIHIESQNSFFPYSWFDFNTIIDNSNTEYLNNSYCIHLWETHLLEPLLKHIDINYLYISDSCFANIFRKFIIDNTKPIIKYICSVGNSGYAISARNYIYALINEGYKIDVEFLRQEFNIKDIDLLNKKDLLVRVLNNNDSRSDYHDIVIFHTLPTFWNYLHNNNNNIKYKYGLTVYETNDLPNEFINNFKFVNKVIVPSKFNYDIFSKYIDTEIIEHNFDTHISYENIKFIYDKNDIVFSFLNKIINNNISINNDDLIILNNTIFIEKPHLKPLNSIDKNNRFIFYTISTWEKRKDIEGLINIYNTFCNINNINNSLLYIKTFPNDTIIDYLINLQSIHKIIFNFNNISENDINYIHKTCNCFISLTKSEGVGINSITAALFNNPIIISSYGGTEHYLNNNTNFINYNLVKAFDEVNPLFNTNNQLWAEINYNHCLEIMYKIYNQQDLHTNTELKNYINTNFNNQIISSKFNNLFTNNLNSDIKQEILVIGEFQLLKKRMDKNIYNFYNFLKNNSNYNLIFIDRNTQNFILDSSIFDVIKIFCNTDNPIILSLVYDNPDKSLVSNLDLYNHIKIFDIEDCYNIEGLVNVIKKHKYTHIFYKYKCIQQQYIINQFPDINFIHFPHYIDNTLFNINFDITKDIDVLLYGNISNFYPFRNRLLQILNNNNLFNFEYIPFPGFGDTQECNHKPLIGKDLSNYINRAKITICTCSMFNYLIKKYIEIPLSGSVLCGNFPSSEENIYKDNMIILNEDWDDNTILNHINDYLKNTEKLNNISYNSHKISQKFTYEKGLDNFNNIISRIITNNI
jgi:predicted O-linked N-acetylglucosamine transferase (SPINDLY family)